MNSEIMRLAAAHEKIETIARAVGLPVVVISAILNSQLARAELARENKVSRV